MNKDLKPCPFCGNKNIEQGYDEYNLDSIACYDCNTYMSSTKSREDVIGKWNTRVSDE